MVKMQIPATPGYHADSKPRRARPADVMEKQHWSESYRYISVVRPTEDKHMFASSFINPVET